MHKNIIACPELLNQMESFESFCQVRKYHVDLLLYWSKLIAYRVNIRSDEGDFDILAKLSDLALYLNQAADTQPSTGIIHLEPSQRMTDRVLRERSKYIFLADQMLEMVRFLTANPDMIQLSDLLKMYALQLGRLRCLDGHFLDDEYAAGMDRMAEELSPRWTENVGHWHYVAWTKLQSGMKP
ncbi:hypothetical protein N7539_003501 [Penicillium diatomitis]|uniref:Uncharacterized protein n=1 Tax=Penicillium diatomitis TaxID=2819901 RepID=A0A9W9XCG1_9EURO|nr:uncharacterized protein N7539_003501 [Penicillium diatomitis]KAJ5488611.1 hypothetical protein N7539_003501 [Penicillium diatomitis]